MDTAVLPVRSRELSRPPVAHGERIQEQCSRSDSPVSNPTTRSTCPECNGEGWVTAKRHDNGHTKYVRPCECQKRTQIARRIPAKYRSATLSDFRGATLDIVMQWLQERPSPGLFLFGGPGVGKTHLAVAICRNLIESGEDVLLRRAATYYRELRGAINSERPEESIFAEYCRVPWLLLDDIGSGALSDFERRYLLDILDERADRFTILTSNLSVDDFAQRLDERIGSRLREFTSVRCAGADRRAQRGIRRTVPEV